MSSSASSDDDDSSTGSKPIPAAQHRRRKRHEATYGVFWEEDDDGDYHSRKRKKNNHSGKDSKGMNFVKGSSVETEIKSTRDEQVHNETEPADLAKMSLDDIETDTTDIPAEEANKYFLSLLSKGKGTKVSSLQSREIPPLNPERKAGETMNRLSSTTAKTGLGYQPVEEEADEDDVEEEEYYDPPLPVLGGGAGLGYSRSKRDTTDHDGGGKLDPSLPISFGRASMRKEQTKISRPDPNLGTWEKHTKGIGMKLLSKMGYKGSGGLRPDAVAAPVAVKVRPNNLGLGFGNFKEATSQKAVPPPRKPPTETTSTASDTRSSSMPSAKKLMQQQTWKKRRRGQKPDLPFVAYSDILDGKKMGEPMTIIDMTGGETSSATSHAPLLGQELLHNVSLLLGTYENRLHSESSFVQTHKRQQETFQTDLESMQRQQSELKEREEKLQTVLKLLDQMEALSGTSLSFALKMEKSQSIIQHLSVIFSAEERDEIKFSETLVPALLGAVVQPELDSWNPMKQYPCAALLRAVLQCVEKKADADVEVADNPCKECLGEIQKVMLKRFVIPKLKRTWESSRWNPVDDNSALEVYGALSDILKEIEPKFTESVDTAVFFSDHERKRTELRDLARFELMEEVVLKRLQQALGDWDGLYLDQWILPWLQYLSPGDVPALVSECKRKLKAIMTKLVRSQNDDLSYINTSIQILSPWKGVLKAESLQNIVSDSVVPRLVRYLSKCQVSDAKKATELPFRMHRQGLVSDIMLLSLLESELLPNWVNKGYSWVQEPDGVANLVKSYCDWKDACFGSSNNLRSLLSSDDGVCRCFYASLLLTGDHSERFANPSNYRNVLARRKKQAKRQAENDVMRKMEPGAVAEAQIKLGGMPTFRQVVEELASTNGLLLIPKQGRRVDGRQVFELGSVSVFFEGNVAFSGNGTTWEPVGLEKLVELAVS